MYGKPKADSTPLDTTPIPEVVKQVLSKFQDIFPEKLPLGLPAERATDHAIDISPGGITTLHHSFDLNTDADRTLLELTFQKAAFNQTGPDNSTA